MQQWRLDRSYALRVAVPFVLFSLLWILVTDQLVARLVSSASDWLWWQTAKGALFVLASTMLILVLLVQAERQERAVRAALVESEELLRLQGAALEASADAIVISDRDANVLWANPAFTTLTGYTREEAIGTNVQEMARFGLHGASFYEEMWKTIGAGGVWRNEMMNRRKDGSVYTEAVTITPVRNDQGSISHFVAMKQDVTEQRLVQRQRLQQERLAALGQMAAGVAHDFNNIMSVILLQSQLLNAGDPLPGAARDRVGLINKQAQNASAMIQQILDFSRLRVLERKPLDLAALLREEAAVLRETLPGNIEVREQMAERSVIVEGDAARLRQVLMNLAFNARDAMPDGGCLLLELAAPARNESLPTVEVMPGDWVCLTVSDTGEGIAPELLNNVFDPFFTTKQPGQGTGLGLSQVQGILSQHGGHVSVKSALREGTAVSIYLPAINGPAST